MATIDADDIPTEIDGVPLVVHDDPIGWAVFTDCDGEQPTFLAFFDARSVAEGFAFRRRYTVVPAAIRNGVIVAADTSDADEGLRAVQALIAEGA